MKAAIYARYYLENQSEKFIDDQVTAKKVEELLALRMSFQATGRSLGVNKRTVIRAYKYINRLIWEKNELAIQHP